MIEVTRHILSNGLRVLHHFDNNTRMTALNLLYDVGAKDDTPEGSGIAHLVEHLMFCGSLNVPDFDAPLQLAGGENNAWTSNDVTNYYTILPTQNAETAFWLESDRMMGLAFSPQSLKIQKQVVIEEYKQRTLNQPYGDIFPLIRSLAYKKHPYHYPVIGRSIEDIERITLDDVKAFYRARYAPNNAILCVSGSLPLDETIALCEKWFAPIPSREVAPRNLPQEEPQLAERHFMVERPVPMDSVVKAYRMCGRAGESYQACDLLSDILGTGPSSQLYRKLVVEQRLFDNISASVTGDIDNGLFIINGRMNQGVSMKRGNDAIIELIEELKQTPLGERELMKSINSFESNHLVSNLSYVDKASNLAYHELIGRAEDINTEVDKYRAITPESMRKTICDLLIPSQCTTLFYRAEEEGV